MPGIGCLGVRLVVPLIAFFEASLRLGTVLAPPDSGQDR